MRIKTTILLLVLLLMLTGCVTTKTSHLLKHPKKMIQVNEEFKRWQNFQMEGIAQVEYKIFVFRKNFVIQKSKTALRLDLLDSGIFGLSGSNISVYVDSTLQIEGLWGNSTFGFEVPDAYKQVYLWGNNAKIDDFEPYMAELFDKNEFTKDGIRFIFNNSMRIKAIEASDKQVRLEFTYDYNAVLSEISVFFANLKICNLKIDKISYNNIDVTKLK